MPGCRRPRSPRSPVPHLTSLYHFDRAGEYGDRKWPGNCGGNLIKDLLKYFRPSGIVFDPMSGSGTCRDVCEELGIPCFAWDIHQGFDACDPNGFPPAETFDVHLGPSALLADEAVRRRSPRPVPRPTLDDFLRRYGQFIRNCAGA